MDSGIFQDDDSIMEKMLIADWSERSKKKHDLLYRL